MSGMEASWPVTEAIIEAARAEVLRLLQVDGARESWETTIDATDVNDIVGEVIDSVAPAIVKEIEQHIHAGDYHDAAGVRRLERRRLIRLLRNHANLHWTGTLSPSVHWASIAADWLGEHADD